MKNNIVNDQINNVKEYFLDNGLQILIKEDHSAPVFSHNLFYRVGSRTDLEGKTGAAHYLEHMQFNGTQKRAKDEIPNSIQKRGGTFNAGTSYDYTVYYMVLPSEGDNLQFALELEADRMRNSIINEKESEREKKVVLEELSMGENNPISILVRETLKEIYPGHPYGDPIIGWEEDVKNTTAADLKAYYDTFYQPNNAVLVIVGDVNAEETYQMAKEAFESIPALRTGIPTLAPRHTRIPNKKQTTVDIAGGTQAVLYAWDTVDFADPDYIPLSALSYILSSGSLSRLEKNLVDTGLASGVDSSIRQGIDSFIFSLLAVTNHTADLNKIKQVLIDEIKRIQAKGVTQAELDRVKAKSETIFLSGLEEPSDLAMQLGFFELVAGDWRQTYKWSEAIEKITRADIQRVAKKYLTEDKVYEGQLINGSNDIQINTIRASESQKSELGVVAEEIVLDNGLRIVLRENHNNALVAMHGTIDAGEAFDTLGGYSYGVSALVADMLDRGTAKYNRDEFSNELEKIGAEFSVTSDSEFVSIEAMSRSKDIEKIISLVAQSLRYPAFSSAEFDKLTAQLALQIEQSKDNSSYIAKVAMKQAIYDADHPLYDLMPEEQLKALENISVDELKKFHSQLYSPNNIILSLSGSFDKAKVLDIIKKYFGDWESQNSSLEFEVPMTSLKKASSPTVIDIPGKSQSIVMLGAAAQLNRTAKDYYAYLIANEVLGGGTALTSMLGHKVRGVEGLVYGVYSNTGATRIPRVFTIRMGTSPDKVDRAIAVTRETFNDFIEGKFTDEEIDKAKSFRRGAFISNNLTTNSSIAASLNYYALWGMDLDTINDYPEIINSLTREEIISAAKKYFHPDKLQTVIVQPKK